MDFNIITTTRNNMIDRRTTGGNTGLVKVAVPCSTDTFLVIQTLVLRINICGKNRHLRQARKRYATVNSLPVKAKYKF